MTDEMTTAETGVTVLKRDLWETTLNAKVQCPHCERTMSLRYRSSLKSPLRFLASWFRALSIKKRPTAI